MRARGNQRGRSSSKSTHGSSCVKLYVCSNPEDSVVERKALRESVFPKLREHCRHALGLDVRVIDPFESSDPSRWPDENIRQQLIKECRENSAGPFLLALVGHQYGPASLPTQVEVSEYQLLLQESQRAGLSSQELEQAYRRDENSIPPSYCLRDADTHTCPAQTQEEKMKREEKEEQLRTTLQTTVSLCVQHGLLTSDRAQRYHRSALDADLRFALANCSGRDISGRCLVYVNKVVNATGEREKRQVDSERQPQSQAATCDHTATHGQLLSELCNDFLPGLIKPSQLLVYTTTTECDQRHGYTTARRRGYTESLCQQVHSDLMGLIDRVNISDEPRLCDAFVREQAEHEELQHILSRFYDVVRTEEEEEVQHYLQQTEERRPLVVTGGPCTGKAVLVAHCARQIKSWLPDCDPVLITFFSSLLVNPSSKRLLSFLCYQIATRYHNSSSPEQESCSCSSEPGERLSGCSWPLWPEGANTAMMTLSELQECFSSLLSHCPSTKQPLVLIIDGLDHIENNSALQTVGSLPSPLPPSVKLILTVSSSRTQILRAFGPQSPSQCMPEDGDKESRCVCLQMRPADRKQSVRMLARLLSGSGRKVTSGQQVLVNQALASCLLPFHTRLLQQHTALWCSDSDVTESSLPKNVHSSISVLLDHLEQKHGASVVRRATSYTVLSRTGLTEAELADLLCGDPQLLCERTQQSEQVSQADVERLLLDLRELLVHRTVAGSQVLFGVSRHFKLVVLKKYLSTHEARREIHSTMADYFSRPSQPFIFSLSAKESGRVNFRKVSELPHHLHESHRWEELEEGLFMSLGFHQALVQAGLLADLVAMLDGEKAMPHSQFSRQRAIIASVLRSWSCSLQRSPLQLLTVMETSLLPYLEVFPALKVYITEIKLERSKRGGGLGLALSPAPSSVAPIQCSTRDVRDRQVSVCEAARMECGMAAEVMDDGSLWFWKGCGSDLVKQSLSCEQEELSFVGVKSSGPFMLLSSQCNKLFLWDMRGSDMFLKEILKTSFKQESSQEMLHRLEGFVASRTKVFMRWKNESFVSVFDVVSETLAHFQCQSHVTCLICSSDGFYVYCGQEDGVVCIFDTNTNRLISICENSVRKEVSLLMLCEERWELACVDRTGNVSLWDVTQAPRLKKSFCGDEGNHILNTDYSEELHLLLVSQSHQVALWDTCSWEQWEQFLAPKGRTFSHAVLSQDGHLFLALLHTCPLVLVWRLDTGECLLSLETDNQPCTLLKTDTDVICVAHDGCLTVWDSDMIAAACAAPKMSGGVTEVVVERTGERFYTSDGSTAVWGWRLETGLPHGSFLHDGPVEKLRLSPDCIQLVTLSAGEIYVWLTESGQNVLRVNGTYATDVLITPNNNFGVSVSERRLSRVWKLSQGSIVCSISSYLADAQVSPESTFLIGRRRGDLLAASLWSGSISKRFSCVGSSEDVVAFCTLPEHPDFVMVMTASGALYTWKVTEETVCKHFQLPHGFHCQPQDFQMSSDGSYALLSAENETIELLDLAQVRLCSFKAEGHIIKTCLDKSGSYVAYVSWHSTLHARPILTVVRLADGERIGTVCLSTIPLTLAMWKRKWVFVGFVDGSVGVYSVSDAMTDLEESAQCRSQLNGRVKQCPFDRVPRRWMPLPSPNVTWP